MRKSRGDRSIKDHVTADLLKIISREDRAILSDSAILSLNATHEAFIFSETLHPFHEEDKRNFPIFLGSEANRLSFEIYGGFFRQYGSKHDKTVDWSKLGELKKLLHPLRMFCKLPTNSLYHLSKAFKLQGGGYPLRRMSLSGMVALEEGFYSLTKKRNTHCLVGAVGDMTMPENMAAFYRMGQVAQNDENETGIIPSYGAASLILENNHSQHLNLAQRYAEVITVQTRYCAHSHITKQEWIDLLQTIPKDYHITTPIVIPYANGVKPLMEEEDKALRVVFPYSPQIRYKQYVGYTGKANNLLDISYALVDSEIKPGEYVVCTGIGIASGFGFTLFKKLNHI